MGEHSFGAGEWGRGAIIDLIFIVIFTFIFLNLLISSFFFIIRNCIARKFGNGNNEKFWWCRKKCQLNLKLMGRLGGDDVVII